MGTGTLVGAFTDTKTLKTVAEGALLREAAAVAVGVGAMELDTLGKVNPPDGPVTGPAAAAAATADLERIERYPTVAENPQTLPFPDANKELSSQPHLPVVLLIDAKQ